MLRRLGVRGKIMVTLGVPILVLVVAFGLLSLRAIDNYDQGRLQNQFVSLVAGQERYIAAVQAERDAALRLAHAGNAATPELEQALETAKTTADAARAAFSAAFSQIDNDDVSGDTRSAVAATATARGDSAIARARSALIAVPIHAPTVQSRYAELIDPHLDLVGVLGNVVPDRNLASYVNAYGAVNTLHDAVVLEGALGANQIVLNENKTMSEGQRRTMALFSSNVEALTTQAASRLDQVTGAGSGLEVPSATFYYTQMHNALRDGNIDSAGQSAIQQWGVSVAQQVADLETLRASVAASMADVADAAEKAALRELIITISAIVLALVATLIIAFLVARQIADPIRALRDAAGRIRDELPRLVDEVAEPGKGPEVVVEPIKVESNDEVGQLARAFNEVNEVTMRVAREQAILRGSIAEMFINVARRDQVLLNRQLVFLDELERSEEDPGTLSNLFRLDHLATRMRRNAESLLVLAGIDSGRRVRQPMPLSDVVRTASSEIEQYDRVQLDLNSDPLMLGHNALPAAHLIAELLENATVFSEPGTPVVVTVTEDSRWVSVIVEDEGLGMSDAEIDEANEKAATYAASEIVGAQRLGLYVVGRLSYKLGATVRFAKAQDRPGTVARVSFSRALFIAQDEVPLDAPVDPLNRQTQAATEAWVAPTVATDAAPLAPRRPVEPEAPVAVPVDLEALTDGATASGMPRRRTRTGGDTAAAAPSVQLSGGLDESAIVLPETVAPSLPDEFVLGAEGWAPPQADIAPLPSLPTRGGAALPTRQPVEAAPVVEPAPLETTPEDVPQRAAVFSSFRTRRSIEFMEQATAAGGAAPAGDVAAEATATAAPVEPEIVVPDVVAEDLVPGLEPDDAVAPPVAPAPATRSAARAAASAEWSATPVETRSAPSAPSAAYAAEQSFAAYQADQTAAAQQDVEQPYAPEQPAAAETHLAPVASAPVGDEELARFRALGAHVGSIASAVDLLEDEYPTRRGRYARYDAPEAPAAVVPEPVAQAPVAEPYGAEPVVEAPVAEAWAAPQWETHAVEDVPVAAYEPVAQYEPLPGVSDAAGLGQRQPAVADEVPAVEVAPAYEPTPSYDAAAAYEPTPSYDAAAGYEPTPSYDAAAGYEPTPSYDAAPADDAAPAYGAAPAVEPAPLAQRQPVAPAHEPFQPAAPSYEAPAQQPFETPAQPAWGAPGAASAPAPSVPTPSGSFPSFADVVGTPPPAAAPEPAPAAPERKGVLGRLFKRKGSSSEAPAASSFAPAQAQPEAPAWGAPGSADAWAQPAAPAAPVAPEPSFAPSAPPAAAPGNSGFSYSAPRIADSFTPAPQEFTPARQTASVEESKPEPTFAFDADLSARLALQAGIQEQALSELSQLSSYRPKQDVSASADPASLTKRVRAETPAPEAQPSVEDSKIDRDAAELRSRLSSFMSATSRGRQEGVEPGAAQTTRPDHAPQSF